MHIILFSTNKLYINPLVMQYSVNTAYKYMQHSIPSTPFFENFLYVHSNLNYYSTRVFKAIDLKSQLVFTYVTRNTMRGVTYKCYKENCLLTRSAS